MQTISLSDLKNYDQALIKEYLEKYPLNQFKIIFPRMDKSKNEDLLPPPAFWDFHLAAWAGQLLKNIAQSFSMFIPDPESNSPIYFNVYIQNREKLVKVLSHCEAGFFQESDEMIRFHDEALKYFRDAFEGETTSHCWGLLYVAKDYLCSR